MAFHGYLKYNDIQRHRI